MPTTGRGRHLEGSLSVIRGPPTGRLPGRGISPWGTGVAAAVVGHRRSGPGRPRRRVVPERRDLPGPPAPLGGEAAVVLSHLRLPGSRCRQRAPLLLDRPRWTVPALSGAHLSPISGRGSGHRHPFRRLGFGSRPALGDTGIVRPGCHLGRLVGHRVGRVACASDGGRGGCRRGRTIARRRRRGRSPVGWRGGRRRRGRRGRRAHHCGPGQTTFCRGAGSRDRRGGAGPGRHGAGMDRTRR